MLTTFFILGLIAFEGWLIYQLTGDIVQLNKDLGEHCEQLKAVTQVLSRQHERINEAENRVLKLADLLKQTSALLNEAEANNQRMVDLAERMIAGGI